MEFDLRLTEKGRSVEDQPPGWRGSPAANVAMVEVKARLKLSGMAREGV